MPEGTGLTLALWLGVSVREALKLKEVVKVAVRDWVRLGQQLPVSPQNSPEKGGRA